MPLPSGIRAIDLMMAMPSDDVPGFQKGGDALKLVVEQMDKHGLERAMIGIDFENEIAIRALSEFPERFFASTEVNPNNGMDEVRKLVALYERFGLKAATSFPAGCHPPVPINDKRFYPLYAKCVELDIPICTCVGVPEQRIPMMAQHVELIDEVCWFFPELKFVMRHGAEPWTALAVKLMLKWPNLYYSTSAFAPVHYPADIIQYANTRGQDKIMYAGSFPTDLSLERVWADMPNVPFRDEVWPKFLRENAIQVFNLDE